MNRRARVLACASVPAAALTASAGWLAFCGHGNAGVILAVMSAPCWAVPVIAWALTRPARPRLTRVERRALDDQMSLGGLLRLTPRREGPPIEAIPEAGDKR